MKLGALQSKLFDHNWFMILSETFISVHWVLNRI